MNYLRDLIFFISNVDMSLTWKIIIARTRTKGDLIRLICKQLFKLYVTFFNSNFNAIKRMVLGQIQNFLSDLIAVIR